MLDLLGWSSAALGAATFVTVAVLAARRVRLAQMERRRRNREHELRPFALALLDGETPPPLGVRDAETLAAIVARYAAWVRGDAREEIARFFEATGAVDASLSALRARKVWRRAAAAFSLGDMASPRAVPALIEALTDDDRDVRAAAARSLGRLGAVPAVEPLVRALVAEALPHGVAGHALIQIGEAALPPLRALVDHEDSAVRDAAVELVGILGSPADAPLLVERVRDMSAEVRAGAVRALGRLAAKDAADSVRAALDDRIPFVRAAAARATGEIGDRASAAILEQVAATDDFAPAQAAARALMRVDPELLMRESCSGRGPHIKEFADRLEVVA